MLQLRIQNNDHSSDVNILCFLLFYCSYCSCCRSFVVVVVVVVIVFCFFFVFVFRFLLLVLILLLLFCLFVALIFQWDYLKFGSLLLFFCYLFNKYFLSCQLIKQQHMRTPI